MLKIHSLEIQKYVQKSSVDVDLILYSPWFTSQIYSITHPGPIGVDTAFLQSLVTDIEQSKDLHTIEKRVIKIEVNGYVLHDFIKTKSKNIKVDLYVSSISRKIFQKLEQVIRAHFPICNSITTHTSSLVYLDKIKEYMVKEDNLIHIFVGGEITELTIIRDDSLVYTATFPVGKHDFLRDMQATIRSYDYDLLYQKQIRFKSKVQEKNFNATKEKWKNSLKNILTAYTKQIPSKILLSTDTKTKEFFVELLTSIKNDDDSLILKNNRIINFDITTLKDIITYKIPIHDQEEDLVLEALI